MRLRNNAWVAATLVAKSARSRAARYTQPRTASDASANRSTHPSALRAFAPNTASTSRSSSASSSHFPCTDLEHLGPGQADPRTGKHREAIRRAREHRRAAENIADGDGDDGNAGRARVEQRGKCACKRQLGGVRFVQPHAAGRQQQHDRSGPLAACFDEHRLQRHAVSLANAPRQEFLVLRRDEHRHAAHPDLSDDDSVVLPRRHAETRDVRARAGGRKPLHAVGVGKRRNASPAETRSEGSDGECAAELVFIDVE